MDPTKKPLGVVTMVYKDYAMLQRWYDYYAAQAGAQNLFVFSHGPDPRHDEIARGANVIRVPRDPTMYRFDRRRWRMMSHFVTGMMSYYNWMILGDVDEIVIVDPDHGSGIMDYVTRTWPEYDQSPVNIAPLCLELIHYPEDETDPVEPGVPVLKRRRTFRPNRNYSKPCLVRESALWRSGGHVNNLRQRHLPDHMYQLHLKYFDRAQITDRAGEKSEAIQDANKNFSEMETWFKTDEVHQQILDDLPLAGEDIDLPEFRAKLRKQVRKGHERFAYGNAKATNLYRIPERFSDVF